MEISSEIKKQAFINTLKQGTVFRLKGPIPFPSDDYHVFVVLNYDPQSDELLLLVNGTSKVEKKLQYLRRVYQENTSKTSVILEADSYHFISKRTIIDCNEVKTINLNSIDFNTNALKAITSDELSDNDIDRIVTSVLNSTNVPAYIKQKITS